MLRTSRGIPVEPAAYNCPQCDVAMTRMARIKHRLRKLVHAHHKTHGGQTPWQLCKDSLCVELKGLIED